MKEIAIRFLAEINHTSVQTLLSVIESNTNSGVTTIRLLISSPGGSVSHGLSAYNLIKGLPIEVTTYNFGQIDSIAVPLYCVGKKRYSVPNARFLIHSVKTAFQQGTVVEEAHLREIEAGLKSDRANIAKTIADNCKKGQQEIEQMMLEARTLSPTEAKDFGLVHEITDQLVPPGLQVIGIG